MDINCDKNQIVDINGFIEKGKQYDLDIELEEDYRNVIYGVVKDHFQIPIEDAVVKLIEVTENGDRKPVSHTFTNDDGEFVFGPLCPDKKYAIDIWANRVEHIKICKHCHRKGKCLKGISLKCDEPFPPCSNDAKA